MNAPKPLTMLVDEAHAQMMRKAFVNQRQRERQKVKAGGSDKELKMIQALLDSIDIKLGNVK